MICHDVATHGLGIQQQHEVPTGSKTPVTSCHIERHSFWAPDGRQVTWDVLGPTVLISVCSTVALEHCTESAAGRIDCNIDYKVQVVQVQLTTCVAQCAVQRGATVTWTTRQHDRLRVAKWRVIKYAPSGQSANRIEAILVTRNWRDWCNCHIGSI
jgi:hypothetical protein